MSTTWGLIVQETDGGGNHKAYASTVLEHVTGTREEALARLEELARSYQPQHPMKPLSTRLYRAGDDFLLVCEGTMRSYGCRFLAAELLYESISNAGDGQRKRRSRWPLR